MKTTAKSHRLMTSFIAMLALLSGCRHGNDDVAPIVGNIAKSYYDNLLRGDYDAFVEAQHHPDTIPHSYKSQLADNARMFMAQMKEEHGGIASISVKRTEVDTLHHAASVFLLMRFRDNTEEQVIVPMVRKGGTWLLR